MAFLRRFPRSPFWFGGFTLPDGRRVQRSTKQTDRKKAQAVVDRWDEAARLAAQKRLGEAQARRVLSEIYGKLHDEPLPTKTARQFLLEWAEGRKVDTSPRTAAAYAQVARDFVESLGARADHDISMLTKQDVATYRETVRRRTSIPTANKSLKYLRIALKRAWADGLAQDNPAAKLDTLKVAGERVRKQAFTLPQLRLLFRHAEGEWRGLVLLGAYTGQRLKDLACLTWQNVVLAERQLKFKTRKTGRQMIIPLVPMVVDYLATLPSADDPASPVFPCAHKLGSAEGSETRLSQQFHGIMVAAGLAEARGKETTGLGHSRRRTVNPLSFHSLRHTTTSLLKSAGVAEAVARDLIGHESPAISAAYTHMPEDTKRAALEKLPDITR